MKSDKIMELFRKRLEEISKVGDTITDKDFDILGKLLDGRELSDEEMIRAVDLIDWVKLVFLKMMLDDEEDQEKRIKLIGEFFESLHFRKQLALSVGLDV